ncbi:MAG: sensor histidine kinase [Deltaproteobacteria bacterium]|nr:MAG: sensor histidine kinase [Deltaproteobacteria bacterium]
MATVEKITPEQGWLLQRERAVAWLRVAFAAVAVLVIQFNPESVARFPELSSFSLGTFLLYSSTVLYFTARKRGTSSPISVLTTGLDVVWIAVIVFSTGGTHTPFFFYYSFPVITASVRWGLRGSIPVALVGVGIYGIIRLTLAAEAMESPIGIDTILIRSLYLLLLAGIFGYISEFEKKQNERLLALSKTAAQAATLRERRRIMYELHDGILQSLATLILRLEGCRGRLLKTQTELAEEIESVENLTRDSMNEIRQFLAGKDSQPIASGMLMDKLLEEMRFLHEGLGLDVILESQPENLALPAVIERETYYVLREALTNVTRHSHASRVEIQLEQMNGTLKGSLTDDGVGFNQKNLRTETGFGLSGMQQRMNKLGGELLVESSPGYGTKVSFVVPTAVPAELSN